MPVGSNADRIGWSTRHESLADFIRGSARDETWRTV